MAIALSGSLILSGSITVSGSIISTGTISMSGSIASASYALNATSASSALNATTGAYANTSTSASYALNATTFNGLASSIFATTGSNTFIGNQVVSGSLTTSGSITATGTITATTLVVQTVTSSTVYSSGSNIFGNAIGNTQTFTGSVLVTGSLTIAGASSATSYNGATIFGSTIACSPIGCFATSCATSFIGGTMSGTTIYGSTAVCSPVGKFTSCIDAGAATFTGNITVDKSSPNMSLNAPTGTTGQYNINNGVGSLMWAMYSTTGGGNSQGNFSLYSAGKTGGAGAVIDITPAGAATFSSTITGTTIYGSTAVCSAVGLFSGCVGIGTASPAVPLQIRDCSVSSGASAIHAYGYDGAANFFTTRGEDPYNAALYLYNNPSAGQGYGTGIIFRAKSDTTVSQIQGAIYTTWTTATDASRTSKMVFTTINSGTSSDKVTILGNGAVIFNCNGTYCSNYGYNFLCANNGSILSGAHVMGNMGAGTQCATPYWCNAGALRLEFNWSTNSLVQFVNHNNCTPFLLQWSADNNATKHCFDYSGNACHYGIVTADSFNSVNGLSATYSLGTIGNGTTITQSIPKNGFWIITNGGNNSGLIMITRAGGSTGVQLIFSTNGNGDVVVGTTSEPSGGNYLRLWISSTGVLSIKNVNAYTGPYYMTSIATY